MKLETLTEQMGDWLDGSGRRSDVVLSSRVRLARNVRGTPFPHRCNDVERARVFERVKTACLAAPSLPEATVWNLEDLPAEDRAIFVERHLASPLLLEGTGARGVVVTEGEGRGVMINEEDHLRIQSVVSGFNLQGALSQAVAVDGGLEGSLDYANSETYGYQTACPTNVGSGMRASLLVHLPALVLAGEAKKLSRSVGEMGMAVRGWFGEGTAALGDFYQLSNQRTLGRTEDQAIAELERVAERALQLEMDARERLAESKNLRRIEDRAFRAVGVLRTARLLTVQQVMACASDLRLGRSLGLFEISDFRLNRLALFGQPGHLSRRMGRTLDGDELAWVRAAWVREEMRQESVGT